MYWSHVPRDIQREILLRLPYDDILCLTKSDEFAWVTKDADYWSKRANVNRREFTDRADINYPKLYLELRYKIMATNLVEDSRILYGSRISYSHYACALRRYILHDEPQPDMKYEFTRYLFDLVCVDDWSNVVTESLHSMVHHPKILRWVSSLGVRVLEYSVCANTLIPAYKAGGIESVRCLDEIVTISWHNVLGDAYQHLDLMKYIVEGKKVDKESLGRTYIKVVRDGFSEVVAYLEPHVDAEDRRLAGYKLRRV